MHRIVGVAAILTLAAAGSAFADDQAEMKALIDRAIKAAGGDANLARFKAETFKAKGKFFGMGEGIDYTGEWNMQRPDKLRVQLEFSAGGQNFTFIRVFDGTKLWNHFGGMTQEITDKDEIAEARESSYSGWVAQLLPLKGEGFQLAPLGEGKVGDKPVVGVRVSHKGHRDVNLWFDKASGLLVKTETIIKDLMAGGKEVTQEAVLSNFKEINGIQQAMKIVITRDGAKYIDSEVTEFEFKEKLDGSVFAKP